MNAVYEASCLGFTNSSIGRIFQTHFWLDQMFRWTFTQEKPGSGRLLELMMWSAKVAFVAMSKHSLPLSGRTRGIHYVGCSHLQPELVDIFWWLMSEITVKIECVGKKNKTTYQIAKLPGERQILWWNCGTWDSAIIHSPRSIFETFDELMPWVSRLRPDLMKYHKINCGRE